MRFKLNSAEQSVLKADDKWTKMTHLKLGQKVIKTDLDAFRW